MEVPNDFYFIFKKTMSLKEKKNPETWLKLLSSALVPRRRKKWTPWNGPLRDSTCMTALFLFLSVTLPQRKPSLWRGCQASLKCRSEIPCEGDPRLLVFWGSPHVIPPRDMSPHAGQTDGCTSHIQKVKHTRLRKRGSPSKPNLLLPLYLGRKSENLQVRGIHQSHKRNT